ncbi:MAG: hypothetical protein KDD90_03835, partial [Sphingomonadaceae bacterium]|nr:hypothetical protein [Sphingomonadaceae bacterium]
MFQTDSPALLLSQAWHRPAGCGRRDDMRFGLEPSYDVGLRHALKNGVAILSGEDFDAGRREQVLGGLLELVSQADRGTEALQGNNFTFAMDEGVAFERLSLFLRYLSDTVENLGERISQAKGVLQGVGAGANVEQAQKELVVDLLNRLLDALERERNYS